MSQQIYAPLGPLEAEAKAMEAAIIFARDIGIQDVIFKGDSLQVCSAMNGCSLTPHAIANVLECIFLHLQFFCSFIFSHIKREGNKPAYLLSQHAKFVQDFETWVEETPKFLEAVIASDVAVCT